MKPKSLNSEEIAKIISEFKTVRDRTLFILAIRTGLRISELLSLKVRDVRQHSLIRDSVSVQRKDVKNKRESRTIALHTEAKVALEKYVSEMHDDSKLFPLTRQHAWRLIKQAAERVFISGNVSTNSTRKAFARRVYLALNKDIVALSRALGHKTTATVGHYVESDQKVIDAAVLAA